eukprot:SAG11_NODE_335_length_10564_cov_23.976015_10_plen_83_part_00
MIGVGFGLAVFGRISYFPLFEPYALTCHRCSSRLVHELLNVKKLVVGMTTFLSPVKLLSVAVLTFETWNVGCILQSVGSFSV